jgi:hypothetical protein
MTSQSGFPSGKAAWRATKTASPATTPTTPIVMPLSEAANAPVVRIRSMIGAPLMMKDDGGDERAQRRDRRSQETPGESALDVVSGEEADERVDHDQRPRRRDEHAPSRYLAEAIFAGLGGIGDLGAMYCGGHPRCG